MPCFTLITCNQLSLLPLVTMPGKQPIFPLDANKLLAKVRRMNARAQKEREARARDEQEHIKSLRVKVHNDDHITTLHLPLFCRHPPPHGPTSPPSQLLGTD